MPRYGVRSRMTPYSAVTMVDVDMDAGGAAGHRTRCGGPRESADRFCRGCGHALAGPGHAEPFA